MNKILVIRVGRAGDMIMITPALLAILDNYPDHEIHLLTSADGKRILNGFNEKITNVYIYTSGWLNCIRNLIKAFVPFFLVNTFGPYFNIRAAASSDVSPLIASVFIVSMTST